MQMTATIMFYILLQVKNISNHILITQDIYYFISVPECYTFGTYMKLQIAACEIKYDLHNSFAVYTCIVIVHSSWKCMIGPQNEIRF